VRLYRARHEVTVAGRQVTLSPRQFGLLEVLMEHGGHAVTRAELMARVWSTEEPCRAETVNIHMRRLRARLRLGSSQPSLIKVVRGRGYALALPEGDPPHVDSQVPPPRRPHGVSRAARSSMSDSGPPVPGRAGRPASVNGSSGYDLCAHCALAERGANPRAVARLATGYVLLNPTQHYRGATTFVAKDCVTAIHDLPELARSAHLIEMAQVAEAVSAAAGTGRLDYEAASHTGPHLHWWLTPRGSDDPHPATAIWQNPDFLHCYWVGPTLRAGHELKATKTRLLEALKQRDVTIEYSYL
jgi:diadenosine tetraphosphate (Ap4A) HIT family hydrolase